MTVLHADPFSTKPKNAHRTNRARYQRAHAHQAPCTPCTSPYTSTKQEPSPLKHEERAKIQWKNTAQSGTSPAAAGAGRTQACLRIQSSKTPYALSKKKT